MAFKKYLYHTTFVILFLMSKQICSQTQKIKDNYILISNTTGINKISGKQLKNIFAGEISYWLNKNKIVLVLPSSKNPLAAAIAKDIYDMSIMSLQKYWLALTFQGNINPPIFLDDDDATIKFIENNPGALGFILEINSNKTKAEIISVY